MHIERRNKLRLLNDLKFELTKLDQQLRIMLENENTTHMHQLLMLKSTIKDSIIKLQTDIIENAAA